MHTNLEGIRELDHASLALTLDLAAAAGPGDLDRRTPCAEWDLEALLRHMAGQHRGFAKAAGGGPTERADFAPVGDAQVIETYRASAAAVEEAFRSLAEDAVLWVPELVEDAPIPAALALAAHAIDNLLHGWDVAQALGRRLDVPDGIAEALFAMIATAPDPPRGPEYAFLAAHAVPDGANAMDRLLGWSGRDPGWGHPAA